MDLDRFSDACVLLSRARMEVVQDVVSCSTEYSWYIDEAMVGFGYQGVEGSTVTVFFEAVDLSLAGEPEESVTFSGPAARLLISSPVRRVRSRYDYASTAA